MQRMQNSDLPKYSEVTQGNWGPEEMMLSAYRPPLNLWRMSSAPSQNMKKDLQREDMEETIQIPRHFGPVAPGNPTWRAQEKEEKEKHQHYRVTSLDYYHNKIQAKKLKMEGKD